MGCEDSSSASLSSGILILLVLLFLSLLGGFVLKTKDCKYFNETAVATLLGLVLGAVLVSSSSPSVGQVMRLNTELFLLLILPPIIFESGFSLDKPMFFKELGGILTYAFLGTVVSSTVTGLLVYVVGFVPYVTSLTFFGSMAFGALISATDTLAVLGILREMKIGRQLYTLVFGESIFNDAITIVLYRTYVALNYDEFAWSDAYLIFWHFFYGFAMSCLVGVSSALVVSLILRHIERSNPANRLQIEASCVVFGPWVCYLVAEACWFSGIVSILFCGIIMARYTVPNLSDLSKSVVGKAYSVCAHAAEILVFVFLGLGLFSFDLSFSGLGLGLFLATTAATFAARACNVGSCSAVLNCFRTHKISRAYQLVIWVSAPRGAISFALAISAQHDFGPVGEVMLTFTLLYSILSIFLVSFSLAPILNLLPVTDQDEVDQSLSYSIEDRFSYIKRLKAQVEVLEENYVYPFFVVEDSNRGSRIEASEWLGEIEIHNQFVRGASHKSESSRELRELDYDSSVTYVNSAIHLSCRTLKYRHVR